MRTTFFAFASQWMFSWIEMLVNKALRPCPSRKPAGEPLRTPVSSFSLRVSFVVSCVYVLCDLCDLLVFVWSFFLFCRRFRHSSVWSKTQGARKSAVFVGVRRAFFRGGEGGVATCASSLSPLFQSLGKFFDVLLVSNVSGRQTSLSVFGSDWSTGSVQKHHRC